MSDRFIIDHGTIHDLTTGRHVQTDPDFGPGRKYEEDGIEQCCALLNSLHQTQSSLDEARADAAALRNVLEDCHAHDIYASGDGAEASRLYRRAHGADFGRVKDVSAADHDASMRKAVAGELGGEMLLEMRRMRLMLGALKAWCSRNGHTYAEKLAMEGLGETYLGERVSLTETKSGA
jgi:hypothetical protein